MGKPKSRLLGGEEEGRFLGRWGFLFLLVVGDGSHELGHLEGGGGGFGAAVVF